MKLLGFARGCHCPRREECKQCRRVRASRLNFEISMADKLGIESRRLRNARSKVIEFIGSFVVEMWR